MSKYNSVQEIRDRYDSLMLTATPSVQAILRSERNDEIASYCADKKDTEECKNASKGMPGWLITLICIIIIILVIVAYKKFKKN
jgi:hypothetical protein